MRAAGPTEGLRQAKYCSSVQRDSSMKASSLLYCASIVGAHSHRSIAFTNFSSVTQATYEYGPVYEVAVML